MLIRIFKKKKEKWQLRVCIHQFIEFAVRKRVLSRVQLSEMETAQ